MELKWLEDLICVAEKGHFARAADERNVTQSALSRRIKSLELWVGAELLDRAHHPIELTPAGREFMTVAREIVRNAYSARATATEYERIAETGITIACLHTLALFFVPTMVKSLRGKIGAFETSIVAETRTIDEYLEGLFNGSSDFFICYSHPSASVEIDQREFPRLDIGIDRVLPYQHRDARPINFDEPSRQSIPFVEYSGTSFMSRVHNSIVQQAPFKKRLKTVFRASLAESLCTAALQGLGVAWLPESIVESNPRANQLNMLGETWSTAMKVSVYRSVSNTRQTVSAIWEALEERAQNL